MPFYPFCYINVFMSLESIAMYATFGNILRLSHGNPHICQVWLVGHTIHGLYLLVTKKSCCSDACPNP